MESRAIHAPARVNGARGHVALAQTPLWFNENIESA